MAEPFLGQIMLFAGNFAPRGFALCNGQILSIQQNQALFALLGTTYGGNGTQTFALPNLQSRVAISYGAGPGLSNYSQGETIGAASTLLTVSNLPEHNHPLMATSTAGTTRSPGPTEVLAKVERNQSFYDGGGSSVQMNAGALGNSGGTIPVSNVQPYLAVTFVIALQGIFPSRN